MWDIRRTVPVDALAEGGTVVAFRLTGVAPKASGWWSTVSEGTPTSGIFIPATRWPRRWRPAVNDVPPWRGDVSWSRAMLNGGVIVHGAVDARRAVPRWLGQSTMAAIPRPGASGVARADAKSPKITDFWALLRLLALLALLPQLISGSRGMPRIRSAIWLRITSEVPPALAMPRAPVISRPANAPVPSWSRPWAPAAPR